MRWFEQLSVSFYGFAAMFVCTCVSAGLLKPVDEWDFLCLPQSGSPVFGPLTAIFISPCVSFWQSSGRAEQSSGNRAL